MKNYIKKYIRNFLYKERATSESYVAYLRRIGVKVGKRTKFYAPMKISIDLTRPWLIDIGDDVQITERVTILTHGFDWSVLKGVYGDVLGSSGGVDRK